MKGTSPDVVKITAHLLYFPRLQPAELLLVCGLVLAASIGRGATFTNVSPISFAVGAPVSPYPSVIPVSGLAGELTGVTVTLNGLSHVFPDDLDILLEGPDGQTVLLMSDAGGGTAITSINLTFADTTSLALPDAGALVGGSYRPTNYGLGDTFPGPAPAGPYGTALSVFNGASANGPWSLFVADDSTANGGGRIASGWTLTLQVTNRPPVITTHPQSQVVSPGGNATFTVAVTGTPPFEYQWLRNGQILVPFGKGESTLRLSGVQAADAGTYAVMVANSANRFGVTSSNAQLNVLGPLALVATPSSQFAAPGDTVTLYVAAAGTPPLSYQWRLNGEFLPGETNATLTLGNVQAANGGGFSVLVWDDREVFATETAELAVRAATGPEPADDFRDRPVLRDFFAGVLQGNSAMATSEPGEPLAPGGGQSVWWEWVAPADGIVTLSARGSAFDTLLRVFTGTTLSNLTAVTGDDDLGGFYTSQVQFNAEQGRPYQIMLDGLDFRGTGGQFTLSLALELTAEKVPVIVAPPEALAVVAGSNATFRVQAGSPETTFQWYFDGVPIRGATGEVYTVLQASGADVGFYSVRLGNHSGRFVQSPPVDLQIGSIEGARLQDKMQLLSSPPANGNRPSAGFIDIGLGVPDFLQAQATNSAALLTPCNNAISTKYRYRGLHATNNGFILVDTAGSEILARLAVYRDPISLNPTPLACDVDSGPALQPAHVLFQATNGLKYVVVVEAYQATGDFDLASVMGTAPAIPGPPACLFVAPGGDLQLQMPAQNWVPVPDCQWRFNGADIPGATGTSFLIEDFNALKAGAYSVVMSNFVRATTNLVAHVNQAGAPELVGTLVAGIGTLDFVIAGSADETFALERAAFVTGPWTPVATNLNPCRPLVFTNFNVLLNAPRFFRAVEWPAPGP